MKFLIQLLLTILLAFVLSLFLPFWSVAIAAFIWGLLLNTRPGPSFLAGFLSISILWISIALITSISNDHVLLDRVAGIFTLNGSLLIVVMALIGGLLGGFGAATGSQLSMLIFPRTRNRNASASPYRM